MTNFRLQLGAIILCTHLNTAKLSDVLAENSGDGLSDQEECEMLSQSQQIVQEMLSQPNVFSLRERVERIRKSILLIDDEDSLG